MKETRKKENQKSVLSGISTISNVRKIKLTPDLKLELKTKYGSEYVNRIKERLETFNCYKYDYISEGHEVEGFSIEPLTEKRLPCIIYNRGGNNDFAYTTNRRILTTLLEMASWGYYVFGSMYSGGSHSEGKDAFGGEDLYDVSNLYKLIKPLSKVDSNKVGLYGGSRGGMMALLLLKKRLIPVKAVVLRGAATDLLRQCKLRPKMKSNVFARCFGATKKKLKERSAVYWVNELPSNIPILIMHGLSDWRVSPMDALDLSRKMYQHKIPHRLIMFEGNDHGLTENFAESQKLTQQWFERFLIKEEPLPDTKEHGK